MIRIQFEKQITSSWMFGLHAFEVWRKFYETTNLKRFEFDFVFDFTVFVHNIYIQRFSEKLTMVRMKGECQYKNNNNNVIVNWPVSNGWKWLFTFWDSCFSKLEMNFVTKSHQIVSLRATFDEVRHQFENFTFAFEFVL